MDEFVDVKDKLVNVKDIQIKPSSESRKFGSSAQSLEKFDILFTKDKHKKTKIWHDGLCQLNPDLNIVIHFFTYHSLHDVFIPPLKATFYDLNMKMIYKLKASREKIFTSSIIETSQFIIEITGSKIDRGEETTVNPLQSTKTKHQLVYTTDKQKKTKKWIDGYVTFDESTKLALFYSDKDELLYKRTIDPNMIEQDSEFESGQYLFIINELVDSGKSSVIADANSPKKLRILQPTLQNNLTPPLGRSNEEIVSILLQKQNKNLSS